MTATVSSKRLSDLTPEFLHSFYQVSEEQVPANRPYTWLMFVTSLNGISALLEEGYLSGTPVAMGRLEEQQLAHLPAAVRERVKEGAAADWRVLNYLWGVPADGILVGAKILRHQPGKEWYPAAGMLEEFRTFRKGLGFNREPYRILVSGSGDLNPAERVFRLDKDYETIIITTDTGGGTLKGRLRERYGTGADTAATIHPMGKEVDFREMMRLLRQDHGVRYLDVQGGPTLAGQLVDEGLVDEFRITYAPQASHTKNTMGAARNPVIDTGRVPTPDPRKRLYLAEADFLAGMMVGSHFIARYRFFTQPR